MKHTAREILTAMGNEFNRVRQVEGYVKALKLYQHRLNEYAGDLCDIMSPKDIMDKVLEIEKELKTLSSTDSGSGSPLDEVRNFLSETVN